jgi:ActR/RegA family two-component response regulator
MTILIAEDDPKSIRNLFSRLSRAGIAYRIAESVDEFNVLYDEREPSFIVVDKRLPVTRSGNEEVMSGVDLVIDLVTIRDFPPDRIILYSFDIAQTEVEELTKRLGVTFVNKMRYSVISSMIAEVIGD